MVQPSRKKVHPNLLDWHAIWKNMMTHCSLFALDESGHPKQWSVADAEKFVQKSNQQYIQSLLNRLKLTSTDNVLDIGCGPGTLTIPIAKIVNSVTAVDSSEGMLHVLSKRASENGIHNITVVNKSWRDLALGIDVGQHYDVAIASNSMNLLGLKEIETGKNEKRMDWNLEDTIDKINAIAKRVYLTMPLVHHNISELFQLCGREYHPFPSYIIVHNVIYQMGIRPTVSYLIVQEQSVNEPKRLLERLEWILNLKPDKIAEIKDKIHNYVDEAETGLQIWSLIEWKS